MLALRSPEPGAGVALRTSEEPLPKSGFVITRITAGVECVGHAQTMSIASARAPPFVLEGYEFGGDAVATACSRRRARARGLGEISIVLFQLRELGCTMNRTSVINLHCVSRDCLRQSFDTAPDSESFNFGRE